MNEIEETVKSFFRSSLNYCNLIDIEINMQEILSKFYVEKEDTINYIWAFFQFIQDEEYKLDKENSYLMNSNLLVINPLLDKKELNELFKEFKIHYRANELILFEIEDEFFVLVRSDHKKLYLSIFYLIENQTIINLKEDLEAIKDNISVDVRLNKSYDTHHNSILFYLLIKNYSYIFTKQDFETKKLLKEISNLFFEAFCELREYKLMAAISLISTIIENNLIKMYIKSENKRPNEGHNINLLNNDIAKRETITLRHTSGQNYVIISRDGNNNNTKLYNSNSKIYLLIKDYATTIRNKVFHFQQSISLDLYHTSVHAIKYLINILMEIEDNEYL